VHLACNCGGAAGDLHFDANAGLSVEEIRPRLRVHGTLAAEVETLAAEDVRHSALQLVLGREGVGVAAQGPRDVASARRLSGSKILARTIGDAKERGESAEARGSGGRSTSKDSEVTEALTSVPSRKTCGSRIVVFMFS